MSNGYNSYFEVRAVDCEDCNTEVEINAVCEGTFYEGKCPLCGTTISRQ